MSTKKRMQNKPKRTRTGKQQLVPIARRSQRNAYEYHSVAPEHDQNLLMTQMLVFGNGTSSQTFRTAINSYVPIASGDTPGEFVNWARMYDFYRVSRFRLSMTVSNNETVPVAVVMYTSNEDPGSTYPLDDASDMPFARKVLLGAKGSGKDTRKMTISGTVGNLVGSIAPETADSYRAIINAAPADVIWGCLTVEVPSGTMATGVSILYELQQTYRFYNADLVSQDSPPTITQLLNAIVAIGPGHDKLTHQQQLDYIQACRVADRERRKKS